MLAFMRAEIFLQLSVTAHRLLSQSVPRQPRPKVPPACLPVSISPINQHCLSPAATCKTCKCACLDNPYLAPRMDFNSDIYVTFPHLAAWVSYRSILRDFTTTIIDKLNLRPSKALDIVIHDLSRRIPCQVPNSLTRGTNTPSLIRNNLSPNSIFYHIYIYSNKQTYRR